MRLIEASLSIMSVSTPYALTNVGQGATAAAKGYAEDIKGLRAEERERAKTLGALGMEKEKLGITKQHYDNLYNLGLQENQIRKIIANKPPGEISLIERYASDPKFRESAKELYGAKKTSEWDQLLMSRMGTGKPIDKEAVLKDVQTFLNK